MTLEFVSLGAKPFPQGQGEALSWPGGWADLALRFVHLHRRPLNSPKENAFTILRTQLFHVKGLSRTEIVGYFIVLACHYPARPWFVAD